MYKIAAHQIKKHSKLIDHQAKKLQKIKKNQMNNLELKLPGKKLNLSSFTIHRLKKKFNILKIVRQFIKKLKISLIYNPSHYKNVLCL